MRSPLGGRTLPSAWQSAIIGAVLALPISIVLNRLPNTEASLGGGVMLIGAFIAGGIAAVRSADPAAAGLRAGFLGGLLAVLLLAVRIGSSLIAGTMAWPLSRAVFWIFASGAGLCIASVFGLACGYVGGWVAHLVIPRRRGGANAS